MKQTIARFDMKLPPRSTKWYLRPLTFLISEPAVIMHRSIIRKYGVDGLKPPYLLLCNHNAFLDFKIATRAIFPHRANYVVAIDGFIGREKLLRDVGCICKRKFTDDIGLIRHLITSVKAGNVLVLYPEARYSLCGTTAVLPSSLGKLCRLLHVPVVSLICHGHHINSPFWNLHSRGVAPVEAELTLLYTPEELEKTSPDKINRRLVEIFQYDDYAWQRSRNIRVRYKKRAEGLHKVLYQCPSCRSEFRMHSKGTRLLCGSCGKEWELSPLNILQAVNGETEYCYIPDWYEWERENVREEIEKGTYSSGLLPVHVDSLPNADRFIRIGNGTLLHDMNGFHVSGRTADGEEFSMEKPVASMYSCHIEYEYLGKYGDCIDLNTLTDTWYIYPESENFSVTKMALATEELYFSQRRASGNPCKPGLA